LTQIPEEQNGAGPGVGASAAADAVPLQDAHRTHANFRIRAQSAPPTVGETGNGKLGSFAPGLPNQDFYAFPRLRSENAAGAKHLGARSHLAGPHSWSLDFRAPKGRSILAQADGLGQEAEPALKRQP